MWTDAGFTERPLNPPKDGQLLHFVVYKRSYIVKVAREMSQALPSPDNCGTPCSTATTGTQGPPGPKGDTGDTGASGASGKNAFTRLTAAFVMPAELGTVTISVADTSWMAVGEPLFIQVAGFMLITVIPSATTVTVQNLEDVANEAYEANAAPTTVIASNGIVTPGGFQGALGSPGPVTLNDLAPTTAKGNIMVDNGANAPNASIVKLGVGTDGTRLKADSGQATGMVYAKVDISNTAEVTGTLALNQGGTGATTAAAARTALGLGTIATQAASAVAITGGTVTGITDLAVADGGTAASTAVNARTNLGIDISLWRYGVLGRSTAVDVNTAGDNAIAINSTRYRVDKMTLDNASISLTTATAAVYTAPAAGGTTLAADQALSALTASTKFKDLTLQAVAGTDVVTAASLYFRVGTPQGAAATANVTVFGWSLA